MIRRTALCQVSTAALLAAPAAGLAQTPAAAPATAEAAVRALIDRYTRSIGRADTALAVHVWRSTSEVTFIHPCGTERGWEQVKRNFYQNTMGAPFSGRTLRTVGPVAVQVYGNTAVAMFEWDFVARFRNPPPTAPATINTNGRETQVLVNFPGAGWRIVNVHYSGRPVTGARQGLRRRDLTPRPAPSAAPAPARA